MDEKISKKKGVMCLWLDRRVCVRYLGFALGCIDCCLDGCDVGRMIGCLEGCDVGCLDG